MTTQLATDTELSAVNSILGSIGQAPVTTLGAVTTDVTNSGQEIVNTFANPQIAIIHNLLMEVTKDVQNEGWHFNKQDNKKVSPDSNKNFVIPNNYLRYDVHGGLYDRNIDVVRKNGKLFDNIADANGEDGYVFSGDLYFDITYLLDFNDVPPAIQRYIIARASVRAATQLVSNPDLVKLLQLEEAQTRSTALEYDCEQGDHTFFGFPQESNYRSYQPYKSLIR
jgi:hypothetical protein